MDRKSFKKNIIESVQIPEMPEVVKEYASKKKYVVHEKNNNKFKVVLKVAYMVIFICLLLVTSISLFSKNGLHNSSLNDIMGVSNYEGKIVNNVYVTYILYSDKYYRNEDKGISDHYDTSISNIVCEIYFVLLEKPIDEATEIIMEKYNNEGLDNLIKRIDRAMRDMVFNKEE